MAVAALLHVHVAILLSSWGLGGGVVGSGICYRLAGFMCNQQSAHALAIYNQKPLAPRRPCQRNPESGIRRNPATVDAHSPHSHSQQPHQPPVDSRQ
jgi:hypothetical protein